jgi:uncharacterized glyoxalase superfamily protein PhnB
MDQIPENTQPTMCPFLSYQDVPAAIAWLSAAFGFKQGAVIPSSGKSIVHAEMYLGNSVIILETAIEKTTCNGPAWNAPGTHGVYVYVEDVNAQFRRAQAAGAKIVRKIQKTIWADGHEVFVCLTRKGTSGALGTTNRRLMTDNH